MRTEWSREAPVHTAYLRVIETDRKDLSSSLIACEGHAQAEAASPAPPRTGSALASDWGAAG